MDTVVTILALVVMLIGVVGTVYPILPGSAITALAALVWAWVLGSTASWIFGLIAVGFALAGWSASWVLTGRRLRREKVPRGPILAGLATGVVGIFVVPVVGLFLGFALGLFVAEWARRKDVRAALSSSVGALKALGLGIVVEFACAGLATSLVFVGALVHAFA
ncbi:MAG: DUF456 domain-containing protein [Micrococcus sp.]|nr:DUF456 domain-containing protein [Micrococcus sp.]